MYKVPEGLTDGKTFTKDKEDEVLLKVLQDADIEEIIPIEFYQN